MNILIVDDDQFVIEGISQGVDWASLPINHIYSAMNVRQAKEILSTVQIQVVLSDIEMPQGSGLELLHWVREKKYRIENIFLTSYAEFSYAKEALQLDTFEYYLKPIAYPELTELIRRACEKVARDAQIERYSEYGQYWLDNQKNIKQGFWQWLLQEEALQEKEIASALQSRQLDYTLDDHFVVLAVNLQTDKDNLQLWRRTMFEYALHNIWDELFALPGFTQEAYLQLASAVWLLVLRADEGANGTVITPACMQFIQSAGEHLFTEVRFLIGQPMPLRQLPVLAKKLVHACAENVADKSQIRFFSELTNSEIEYRPPELSLYEALLKNGNTARILENLDKYLNEHKNRGTINVSVMRQLCCDIQQLIYSYLHQNGIEAHRLFANETNERLQRDSLNSVGSLRDFLHYLISVSVDYVTFSQQSATVVDRVVQYIENNYNQDISRTTLGEVVYLNPDYLARTFKREKGVSIVKYLLLLRMNRAKQLLQDTDISINEVAVQVGYTNFSYFSRLFKEFTGYAPSEYRMIKSDNSVL